MAPIDETFDFLNVKTRHLDDVAAQDVTKKDEDSKGNMNIDTYETVLTSYFRS